MPKNGGTAKGRKQAGVAELADAPDLGSGAVRRGSSSLFARTTHTSGSDSVVECDLAKVEVAGSNPVFRSINRKFREDEYFPGTLCGCSSTVEPQPSKLVAWVRFPSPAPYTPKPEREILLDKAWAISSVGRAPDS